MSDELEILKLRARLLELASSVRQPQQAWLDTFTAELLLLRRRAELEDAMGKKRAQRTGKVLQPDLSPFLTALNDVRQMATREGWCYWHVHAIIVAIDQYAEAATGNREYFLNKPHSVGERSGVTLVSSPVASKTAISVQMRKCLDEEDRIKGGRGLRPRQSSCHVNPCEQSAPRFHPPLDA